MKKSNMHRKQIPLTTVALTTARPSASQRLGASRRICSYILAIKLHHYYSALSLPSYRTIRSTIRYTSTEDSNQSQSIPYRTTDHMHSTVFEYILTVQFKVPADPNH